MKVHNCELASRRFGPSRVKLAAAAILLGMAAPAVAHAITTISQGYATKENLALGSIVSLQKNASDAVTAASTGNVDGLLGIVINNGNSLLSLSNDGTSQIQVATSGIVGVLVSDINGSVSTGDEITASPIAGVGMKATTNVKVIGIAQDDLSGKDGSKQSYTDKSGKKHSVLIGQVPVLVNVSYYYKQPDKTVIPAALQNIANALAGKTVDTVPILISVGVFLVTLIVVASIVYSMIKSSIISVGRNPMSQSAIYRGLVQMSALVVAILGVAITSIYMILTRL